MSGVGFTHYMKRILETGVIFVGHTKPKKQKEMKTTIVYCKPMKRITNNRVGSTITIINAAVMSDFLAMFAILGSRVVAILALACNFTIMNTAN